MGIPHKEIIEEQLKKAQEKLQAAKALFRDGFLDDVISRAYYAIFHAASAVLLSKGITVDSHSGLKTMFGLHFIKTGEISKEYGRSLNKLKDERENGDYDIFVSFEKEDAIDAIKEAEEFINAMREYLKKVG